MKIQNKHEMRLLNRKNVSFVAGVGNLRHTG